VRIVDFFLSIAESLGDSRPGREFTRYTKPTMVTYYNEAMCFVASHRPDLFTNMVIVKMTPGRHQDARCCGCTDVQGVVAQVDENGAEIKDLTTLPPGQGTGTSTRRTYRTPCRKTVGGVPTITNVVLDAGVAGAFAVDPPVPVGADMWLKVRCTAPPTALTLADLDAGKGFGWCKFAPAIRSYMLYRLLGADRNAAGASQEAQAELKAAYTYLGVQIKMEERQDS
jgi:hypothetical protein